MRRAIRAAAVACLLGAGSAVAFVATGTAQAATSICEQFGSTTVQGRYIVMNNRWGTSAQQCINATDSGFTITTQQGTSPTNSAPVSYPAIYLGCHYTACSPGTNLPLKLNSIGSSTSSINYTYVSGAIFDASYDIWLDPTPKTNGVNAQEVMIWFNRQGSIQPIGSSVGTTTIGGKSWEVWRGSNGQNAVVSYVAPSAITSWNFNVLDFLNDVKNRGAITGDWYLTSIQAGFEPWNGGAGLAISNFTAAVNGGAPPPPPPTTPPTTPPTNPPPAGGCRVKYTPNVWTGGFVADVAVTNAGSSTVNGWTLGFTLPGGQQITNSWNAALSGSSGAVTAKNVSWNGSIPPNSSQSFGFQGTYSGSFSAPASFTLNGSSCSKA
ncbi:MAG: hypothetical protein QOH97_2233 [Actinoplanes sp.]|jgi:hypothetical protein|nr:hypothetical protein [Actinoplanes sp.]